MTPRRSGQSKSIRKDVFVHSVLPYATTELLTTCAYLTCLKDDLDTSSKSSSTQIITVIKSDVRPHKIVTAWRINRSRTPSAPDDIRRQSIIKCIAITRNSIQRLNIVK